MALDYNSLLLAVGFSAAGLAMALFGSWLIARTERFMLTWSLGLLLIVFNIMVYSHYVQSPDPVTGALSMVLLPLSFAIVYGAAVQFARGLSPLRPILWAAPATAIAVALPMALGYDGIGFMSGNTLAALLFLGCAREYWAARAEARVPLVALTVLYTATAASFGLCALVLALQGQAVLAAPPSNWAEDLNVIVCLIGMTGIGALSLALNQGRIAARHRREALTDPLTGLVNRRAVFERFNAGPLPEDTVIVVFDLDHFKSINDQHGHGAGDEVLRRFAAVLVAAGRDGDIAARLGGEEFALILPATPALMAVQMADLIRRRFAAERFRFTARDIGFTVSAGLAVAGESGPGFEPTLTAADRALYLAKSGGRDRIIPASRLLAG